MKTDRTIRLEELLRTKFNDRNDFYVFECTIGWYGGEIVDCIKYNCQREISCYEIKQSKQDFYSKNKLTFIGHKNYFVMPYELYEQVKNDIDWDIGVYVAIDRREQVEEKETNEFGVTFTKTYMKCIDGLNELYCIKPAKSRDLRADKEVILSSMLRSMQRNITSKQ